MAANLPKHKTESPAIVCIDAPCLFATVHWPYLAGTAIAKAHQTIQLLWSSSAKHFRQRSSITQYKIMSRDASQEEALAAAGAMAMATTELEYRVELLNRCAIRRI